MMRMHGLPAGLMLAAGVYGTLREEFDTIVD